MKLSFFKRLEITLEVRIIKEQLTHQAIPLLLSLKKALNIWVEIIANNLWSHFLEL